MNSGRLADLRLALRMVHRRPVLSAAVVVPIALAIAINTALFSVMDGLLFRPLPFHKPEELVAIDYRRVGDRVPELAYQPSLAAARERLRADLEGSPLLAGATQAGFTSSLEPGAREMGIQTTGIDSRFFHLLGLKPALGTDFTMEDEISPTLSSQSALPLPVIIDNGLWRRVFARDPEILGIRELAGRKVRIVGVMGAGVKFPGETNVWIPVRVLRNRPPAYARLAPGATVEQLAARFPDLTITPLADHVRPDGSRTLLVLFGAACLLLLVAWVQVAALIFAGAVGRCHEVGVRLALGGGRLRLVRQFAIENAVLAGMSFALAWLVARPLTSFVVGTLPRELSRGQYLTPDERTFVFACAASLIGLGLLTAIPLGVIWRTSPLPLLQGHVGRLPFSAERLRHALLVAQVALTALLLYLSGLTVHSFVRVATFDYGFDSRHVLLFTPPLPPVPAGADLTKYGGSDPIFEARYAEKQRRIAESLEALHGIPGVIAAASFFRLPLVTRGSRPFTTEPGRPDPSWDEVTEFAGRPLLPPIRVRGNVVSPDFVRALGAHLTFGRTFDDPEYTGEDNVVVVNETLARQLVPPVSVMGTELQPGLLGATIWIRSQRIRARIIGVIKDLVYSTPTEPSVPQCFLPTHRAAAAAVVAIRTTPSVDAAFPAVHTVLLRVWGDGLTSRQFTLLRDAWHTALVPFSSKALLISLIGVFCVPLAAIGLTGALLYSVQVRTRETAIRIALGAEPPMVSRAVLRHALIIVALGLVFGIASGAAIGRVISHHLFDVRPADPWTIAGVTMGLLALAWLAALLPARHASRIEPAVALRHD